MTKSIKSVDETGKEIKNLKQWKLKNPYKLYFDSLFECTAYHLFKDAGFDVNPSPETRLLLPKLEAWSLSAIKKKLYKSTIRTLSYTPDFEIKCPSGHIVYVETKGFFRDQARIRFKLFQHS